MPVGPALLLAAELLDRTDARYCDPDDIVAAAIPVADTTGGAVTGWLLFGVSCDRPHPTTDPEAPTKERDEQPCNG